MNPDLFKSDLRKALELELPYVDRIHREREVPAINLLESRVTPRVTSPSSSQIAQNKAVPASVLALLGYSNQTSSSVLPSLLFIRRTETVDTHKGQIAYPGGHTESEEVDHPELTALRETEEEVGIPRQAIQLFGRLPSLYTATGYLIQPFVGMLKGVIEDTPLVLDPRETAEALWAPLDSLNSPGVYRSEKFQVGRIHYPIDVYQYEDYRIWGATGSMTKNLLDRLNQVGTFLR